MPKYSFCSTIAIVFITAYPVNEKCTEDITRWREDMNFVM